jgi:hypothetical protein
MRDDELGWESREITGTATLACERCGRPVSPMSLRHAEDDASADGGAGMRICADCLDAIERGTEPIELDDDEPVL